MVNDYGYVSCFLVEPQANEIVAILMEHGIPPIPKHNLHATLMYDQRDLEKPLALLDPRKEFKGAVTRLEILGDGLVFHLYSPDIVKEHERLKEAGYVHSFESAMPHMSLTYAFDKYDILKLERAFSDWSGRELTFNQSSFGTK